MKIIEHPNPVCRYSLLNIPSCTRYTCILEMTLISAHLERKCLWKTSLLNFAYMGSVAARIYAFIQSTASPPGLAPVNCIALNRVHSGAKLSQWFHILLKQMDVWVGNMASMSPFRNKHWHIFASNGRIFPANGCLLPLEISSPLVLQIVLNCNKYLRDELLVFEMRELETHGNPTSTGLTSCIPSLKKTLMQSVGMPSKFPGLKTKRLWSIEGSRMNITADQTVMLWEWCSFSRWVCRYRRYRSIVGRAGSIRGPSCWPDPISWSTLEEMVHGGVLFDRVNLRKLWKLLFVHIWSSISPKSQRRNHHLPGQGSTFERLFRHFRWEERSVAWEDLLWRFRACGRANVELMSHGLEYIVRTWSRLRFIRWSLKILKT